MRYRVAMLRWHLTSGGARWTRGSVVGALTLLLGLVAHVAAGGHAPGPVPLLVTGALLSVLAVLLSGRRWTASPLLGLFLMAQTGVHLTSMSAAPHGSMLDPLMATTHLVAAVVLVAVVLKGEHALLTLLDLVLPRAGRRAAALPAVGSTPMLLTTTAPVTSWIPAGLQGRAPPVSA